MLNQGKGLSKTAKKLNLKLSTAKLILRKYKQTGKFHMRNLKENSTIVDPNLNGMQEQDVAHNFNQ